MLLFVALLSTAVAQDWFDMIKDKVSAIVTGAADTCSNKYITGPYIEGVLCGTLVPDEIQMKLGITLGPASPWCKALACAYRAMGCPEPTYRVEASIIKATGVSENCAETLGIDQCDKLAKFIAKNPQAKPQSKRAIDMNADEAEEAKLVAATALRAHFPKVEGLDEAVPLSADKRQLDAIVANLQVCSPLIQVGLQLLESSVKLPVNVSTLLGPCGDICNYALCGLNILCAEEAHPLLSLVNAQRKGSCPDLTCASFVKAPPSVCEGVPCQVMPGSLNTQNCPPPQQIITPSKTSKMDCCPRCDAPCRGVNCPAVQCAEPKWPACIANVVQKYDQYDCCPQCIDPCITKRNACPPPPASCADGLILGPARPGDCCLSCQPKCAGISCEGKPQKASDCTGGMVFRAAKNSQSDNPTMCSDCCGACVPGNGAFQTTDAGALELALAVVVAMCAALVF